MNGPSFRTGSCRLLAPFLLLGFLLLAGCSGDTRSDGRPGILTVMQSSVAIGDPHICSDSVNRLSLVFSIYDALITRDAAGNYVPALARSWSVAEDDLTWTFHLRPDVQFHNGEILTADDVVATLERVLDPAIGGAFGTQGVYLSYLGDAGISAHDELTVRIVTPEPMADLLDLLVAMPIGPASELHRLPGEYIGSGPYRIGAIREGQAILEAHSGYWGPEPEYREIHWLAEPDPEVRVEALMNGRVDVIAGLRPADRERMEGEGSGLIHELESGLCIIFMCNAFEGPCADRRVRQALNYALDVEAIIRDVKEGAATPLNGYLTPHHFGHNPQTPVYGYDPDRARTLLAEAGFAGGLELVLDIPAAMPDEAPALAQMMTEQYREVGISVEVVVHEDRAAYSEMVREKRINDACCFDSSPRSTWRVLREKLHSTLQGPWWQGYDNPRVNSLIAEAEATFSDQDRQAIYRRIYTLVRDDAPWIFLYRPTSIWAVSSMALPQWRPRADGLLLF